MNADILRIPTLHQKYRSDIYIQYYDDKLLFYPVVGPLKQELTITVKSIDDSNKLFRKSEKLFATIEVPGGAIGITYQGFLYTLIRVVMLRGYSYYLDDRRIAKTTGGAFPPPRLDLMHGFRFSQQKLLTDALLQDCSGLIGAPTRYGKTTLMINTLRAYPSLATCVVAPGVDLVRQLYNDIKGPRGIQGRPVKLVEGTGIKGDKYAEGPGVISVCSITSLHKIDPDTIDLVLADEPHALVSDTRLRLIDNFPKARRLGYGATLKGRFDGKDKLIEGVFGHVLAERTYTEAVQEGAICPLHILFLKIELDGKPARSRNTAYNNILFHSKAAANLAKSICEDVIPADFQTMIFIKDEKQAELTQKALGEDSVIAMAKRMTNKEREECDRLMKENIIKRCLCTKIYVQGVTFSDVRVLLNLEAGGNNTSAIQKPGRLAEIRPGKKCGIVIDLLFVPPGEKWGGFEWKTNAWINLCKDSEARLTAYREKGYDITVVNNIDQLKDKFNELI